MNVLTALNELLKRPDDTIGRAEERGPSHSVALFTGALACYLVYGAAAGLFQGGWTVAIALFKVPLIIIASLLLCVPSLYVFTTLAGADYSPRAFALALAGFSGIAGLILLALMPVVWLFTVSSISLLFVTWMHVFAWIVALIFAAQFLSRAATKAGTAIAFWIILLFFVSLQMTTYVRPVLWHNAGEPLFKQEKESFFSHLHQVSVWKPAEAVKKVNR